MPRTVIVGGPRTGKTTLAKKLGRKTLSSDDVRHLGWSEASEHIATHMGRGNDGVIEGVATARALRKWLASHPEGKPCDEVIHLKTPHVECSKGQAAMGKGCETVFAEIEPELRRRGVVIREGGDE
jgi:adenylate kinase family enzyme